MKFYTLDNIKDGEKIESEGIDIMTMSKAFKILDKKSENKTLDSVMGLSFVFLEKPYKFRTEDNLSFVYQDKKMVFALVEAGKIFEVTDGNNQVFFCTLHESLVKTFSSKEALGKEITTSSVTSEDPAVKKAVAWLDSGRVGMSSATMCAALFPELKVHPAIKKMYDWDDKLEVNIPHDNGDFGRCRKFLEAVPEARAKLDKLKKLNSTWSNLVEKWDEIEKLMDEGKTDESYALIKECAKKKRKVSP